MIQGSSLKNDFISLLERFLNSSQESMRTRTGTGTRVGSPVKIAVKEPRVIKAKKAVVKKKIFKKREVDDG